MKRVPTYTASETSLGCPNLECDGLLADLVWDAEQLHGDFHGRTCQKCGLHLAEMYDGPAISLSHQEHPEVVFRTENGASEDVTYYFPGHPKKRPKPT
ncbi:MAG: hypothetical protein V1716_02160 [Candidatus Uhrbacteria bacterium]